MSSNTRELHVEDVHFGYDTVMNVRDAKYELVNGIRTPKQLVDAWTCLYQAEKNYKELITEIDKYLYNYIGKMIRKVDPNSKDITMRFLDEKEHNIIGRPKMLVSDAVEKLRKTLDYVAFELSLLNNPNLDEKIPQFVIAESEKKFQDQRRKLKYLTDEQKSEFIEKLQPYRGNYLLGALNELAGLSKHRRLLSSWNNTSWSIVCTSRDKVHKHKDFNFVYPLVNGKVILAKPKKVEIILINKYLAFELLVALIEHVAEIVKASHCFFENRPFRMKIEYASKPDVQMP